MKSRSCGLVPRIGTAESATPHPDPCGGQAPRYIFSFRHRSIPGLQFGAFRRRRAGIEGDWRAHFRTNRSCRLAPAHQGMKSRSCGLVPGIGTAESAAPHPDPCGGQAPALHFFIPPSPSSLQFGGFRRRTAGIEGASRTNRSCRLAPAHQGMKSRSCGLVPRIGTADSATPHPDPCGGQAPALHFLIPPSTIGLQFGTFRRWRAGMTVNAKIAYGVISTFIDSLLRSVIMAKASCH